MKNKLLILVLASLALGLAACQPAPQTALLTAPQATQIPVATPIPLPASPTAVQMPVPSLAPAATVATADPIQGAEKTVTDYFAALATGDAKTSASLLSTFSLTHAAMTRGDAQAEIKTGLDLGAQRSDLQIIDAKAFDAKTVLVHVTYQESLKDSKTGKLTTTPRDELWPVRLESGAWRYNRGNLIDFKTLDVKERTLSGVTVKPQEVDRYSDRLSLVLLVQNATQDAVVWGSPSQVLATFHWGSQAVQADPKVIVIDRLRSYPAVTIDASGLFDTYPDAVDLVQFIHYTGGPWYTFQLGS
jgi:hypothetical protein